jgi:hypothetical protein
MSNYLPHTALAYIRTLYSTRNIYQSLVICNDNNSIEPLTDALIVEGYPVIKASTDNGITKFQEFDYRMLSMTLSEWNNIKKTVITGSVNIIIFIGCKPQDGDTFIMRDASVFIFSS